MKRTMIAALAIGLGVGLVGAEDVKQDFDGAQPVGVAENLMGGGAAGIALAAGAVGPQDIIPARNENENAVIPGRTMLTMLLEPEKNSFLEILAASALKSKDINAGMGFNNCWASLDMVVGDKVSRTVCCLATMHNGVPVANPQLACYTDNDRKKSLTTVSDCLNNCTATWLKCTSDTPVYCLCKHTKCSNTCRSVVDTKVCTPGS